MCITSGLQNERSLFELGKLASHLNGEWFVARYGVTTWFRVRKLGGAEVKVKGKGSVTKRVPLISDELLPFTFASGQASYLASFLPTPALPVRLRKQNDRLFLFCGGLQREVRHHWSVI